MSFLSISGVPPVCLLPYLLGAIIDDCRNDLHHLVVWSVVVEINSTGFVTTTHKVFSSDSTFKANAFDRKIII